MELLNTNCKGRMIARLSEILPEISVFGGQFVSLAAAKRLEELDAILPSQGRVKDSLVEILGDSPVYTFLFEEISRELRDTQEFSLEKEVVPLVSISGFENANAVSERLIEQLCALPIQYSFSLELSGGLGAAISDAALEIKVSRESRVVTPKEGFSAEFPLLTGNRSRDNRFHEVGLMGNIGGIEWDAKHSHVQLIREGYVGEFGTGVTLENTISEFKAIAGMLIALRLAQVSTSYRPHTPQQKVYVHRREGAQWVLCRVHKLDRQVSEAWMDLELVDIESLGIEEARFGAFIKERLSNLATVYSDRTKSERIRLGAQWLFESYAGENELLSFVQATVSMEILLGDKSSTDIVGITELLSNRCAYLISESQTQREGVMREFRDIYRVRSKIVHVGHSRLKEAERSLLHKLRWMVARVIQEEIALLRKEVRKDA